MSKFNGVNTINTYSSLDVLPPTVDEKVEKHRVEEGTDTFVFAKIQLAKLINQETSKANLQGRLNALTQLKADLINERLRTPVQEWQALTKIIEKQQAQIISEIHEANITQ